MGCMVVANHNRTMDSKQIVRLEYDHGVIGEISIRIGNRQGVSVGM